MIFMNIQHEFMLSIVNYKARYGTLSGIIVKSVGRQCGLNSRSERSGRL